MAPQMWGETVRAVMDSGGWHCLQSVPNAYYLPADGRHEDDSGSVCHGVGPKLISWEPHLGQKWTLGKPWAEVGSLGTLLGPKGALLRPTGFYSAFSTEATWQHCE